MSTFNSQFLSPGSYTLETNQAITPAPISTSAAGMVGTASKGPVNVLTLITSRTQLRQVFGLCAGPIGEECHYGLYGADEFLQQGSILWYVRIGGYGIASANPLVFSNGATAVLSFAVLSPGTWANGYSVMIGNGTDANTFRVTVADNKGNILEVYDRVLLGTANLDAANYIATRINGVSQFVTVTVSAPSQTTLTWTNSLAQTTTLAFAGGANGAEDSNAIVGVVGAPPVSSPTGLQIFANKNSALIGTLSAPGFYEAIVVQELLTIAQTRQDCVALIDPPKGLTVQQVVAWHNGILAGSDLTASLIGSFATLFYPWVQINDADADMLIWIPLSGHVAQRIAYNDAVAAPWYDPTGFTRGMLTDVLQLEHNPQQGDLDYMTSGGNAVNAAVNFPGQGIALWMQRTLERDDSPPSRLNVRRGVIYARQQVQSGTLQFVHEQNDPTEWLLAKLAVMSILQPIQDARGLYSYTVICDGTNNSAQSHRMNIYIGIAPTASAEEVISQFVYQASGLNVTEL